MDMKQATEIKRRLQSEGKLPPPDSTPPPKKATAGSAGANTGLKLSKAKDLYEFGVIVGAEIVDNPLKAGWLLQIKSRTGEMLTLETDRGGVRVFKTLDAAFKTCEEIGLDRVLVYRKR